MTLLSMTVIIWLGAMLAGFLGALTGLGGGVVIVPLLVLGFGVDMKYAIGASLVSIIATSSGAAAAYVRDGLSNVRIGMFLEVATTSGALLGALASSAVPTTVLSIMFGCVLIGSAYLSLRPGIQDENPAPASGLGETLRLSGNYPSAKGKKFYRVQNVPGGFILMFVAGVLSALLGIGAGALKVLAMDRIMRIPFKVSTTTSNFMIGVTAATGAGVYLNNGYIDPTLAMPVTLGVLIGSMAGAKVLLGAKSATLRYVFAAAVLFIGVEMIYKGMSGKM
jgi:uncharacterized membrane protein YfcA